MTTISAAATAAPPTLVPRWLLFSISFWGGFQIMVLEICGFRVLQTNLGSSVIVTGTLLTVVMVLLSGGYYTGGQLSRRYGLRVLFGLLALSAVYTTLVTALLLEPICALGLALYDALGSHVYLRSGLPATLLSMVLYGPPVFLMSMISPYLIRLRTLDRAEASDPGVQSGFFMSLSTLGSIAGTMLASYVFVPFFGVARSAIWSSAVFFLLVAGAWFKAGSPLPRGIGVRMLGTAGGVLLFLLTLGLHTPERDPSVVYQAESHYGELSVLREVDAAGRPILTYHPSRVYTHSMLYPEEPLRDLEGSMYLVPGLLRPPESILVLGSAAGGSLRALELAFPRARITGVDLDPKVHEVATQVFGVDPARSQLVTADARMHLTGSSERYDFIIVDLFSGEFIPSHCVSVEFFALVRQRLTPQGSVFINTNMNDIPHELAGSSEPFRAIRHLQATLRSAGFEAAFENSFFHSLFAFPDSLSAAEFHRRLLVQLADPSRSAPLRAAAGLAAFTSSEVPLGRTRYQPFTDTWTPSFLIELKSNASGVYAALEAEATPAATAAASPEAAVAQRTLGRHLAEWRNSEEAGLTDAGALIESLNSLTVPLGPEAFATAARHFRFSREFEANRAPARSAWARLAELYTRLHQHGYANDYDSVLGVLGELTELQRAASPG